MIVSIHWVSQNNVFSRYTCIASHCPYPFTPVTYDRRHHHPFPQTRQLNHLYVKILIGVLYGVGWELEDELEEEGGVGVLRIHCVIWEVCDKFRKRLSTLIHMGGPFQSTYLYVFDLLLLFHLPVLRNQSAPRFQWFSDIDPSLGVRVHYYSFFLSISVWYPYHSPLPRFHISYLDLFNEENFTLLDSIIICNSNKKVPWWSPLC